MWNWTSRYEDPACAIGVKSMLRESAIARGSVGPRKWKTTAIQACMLLCGLAGEAAIADSATTTQPAASQPRLLKFTDLERSRILQHSPLPPPPPDPTNAVADDPRAAHLGQFLFFDTRLSSNGKVSCATCHDPARGFADDKTLPEGVGTGTRNTQTVWNAAYGRWYFWDGRADTLWSQALGPIEGEHELNFSRMEVAHLLQADAALRAAYERLFGAMPDLSDSARFPPRARPMPDKPEDPAHRAWIAMQPDDRAAVNRVLAGALKAIAAYERTLISRASPFDQFAAALRAGDAGLAGRYPLDAQRGLRIFLGKGNCRLCHSGPQFSDGEFHDIRIPPLAGGPAIDSARYDGVKRLLAGEFNARGPHSDQRDGPAAEKLEFLNSRPEFWGLFKTPTLRNVARTPPYMHQGQFATLGKVLHYYSTLENALPPNHHGARETVLVPLGLSPGEMLDVIAFLESLTDESVDPTLLGKPRTPLLD